jgi:pyrroline-5-carboxylate reductase
MATGKAFRTSFSIVEVRHTSTTAITRGKRSQGAYDGVVTAKQRLVEHPLSVMPTNMLLRSLFIATVSSNKMLLLPALRLLSFFAKPNRSFIFDVDRNPVLKAILKRTLYNQFCAGETEKETRACVNQLKDLGFKGVILTFAKETVFDSKAKQSQHVSSTTAKFHEMEAAVADDTDIEAWRVGTLKTVDLISEGDILAIK